MALKVHLELVLALGLSVASLGLFVLMLVVLANFEIQILTHRKLILLLVLLGHDVPRPNRRQVVR